METYPIKGPWLGSLSVLSRPRGGDWLDDEIAHVKAAGLNIIVSLLTHEEERELNLRNERNAVEAAGLKFFSLPIEDLGVPTSRTDTLALLTKIEKLLNAGSNVAVHCRQGIGRSGMIAASLLVLAGFAQSAAIEEVSRARGTRVPETEAQQLWVLELERSLEPAGTRR